MAVMKIHDLRKIDLTMENLPTTLPLRRHTTGEQDCRLRGNEENYCVDQTYPLRNVVFVELRWMDKTKTDYEVRYYRMVNTITRRQNKYCYLRIK